MDERELQSDADAPSRDKIDEIAERALAESALDKSIADNSTERVATARPSGRGPDHLFDPEKEVTRLPDRTAARPDGALPGAPGRAVTNPDNIYQLPPATAKTIVGKLKQRHQLRAKLIERRDRADARQGDLAHEINQAILTRDNASGRFLLDESAASEKAFDDARALLLDLQDAEAKNEDLMIALKSGARQIDDEIKRLHAQEVTERRAIIPEIIEKYAADAVIAVAQNLAMHMVLKALEGGMRVQEQDHAQRARDCMRDAGGREFQIELAKNKLRAEYNLEDIL